MVNDNISRVSNAYSEAHARVYQDNVLRQEKNNSIGEATRKIVKYNKRLISEHKLNISAKSSIRIQQKPLYPEAASNPFEMEKWGRKRKDIQALNVKKQKYSLYTAQQIINVSDNIIDVNKKQSGKSDNKSQVTERKGTCNKKMEREHKIFKTKNKRISNKIQFKGFSRDKTAKEKVVGNVLNSINNTIEDVTQAAMENNEKTNVDNWTTNLNGNVHSTDEHSIKANILRENSAVGRCGILPNGLINSVLHYSISQSAYVKIGIYESKTNVSLSHSEFQMTAKEFYTVVNTYMWVDSLIIDCYTVTHMDEWKNENISYMPTDIANKAIGNFASKRKGTASEIFRIKTPLKDKLLIPYVFEGHCSLLFVNINEGTVAIMDPLKNSGDKGRVFEAFTEYIGACGEPCTLSDLKHIAWKIVDITNRPYQAEIDSSNCALYVMYYIHCIANLVIFDLKFDPLEYRKTVAERLILKSENISNKCMFCFTESTKTSIKKVCTFCNRWVHNKCSRKSNEDTEEEDDNFNLRRMNKKRKVIMRTENKDKEEENSINDFTCKLCHRHNEGGIKRTRH